MLEDTDISRRTWTRSVESVKKIGYMDGASDGRVIMFQSSFNMGYKQGFSFGIELGFKNAVKGLQQENNPNVDLNDMQDSRKINCQLCLNGIPPEQNLVNLYNIQQEKNNELFIGINAKQPI